MNEFYKNKKVLVTGHTGFKGSWLSVMLKLLGAKVTGFSLPPEDPINHFSLLKLDREIHSILGDLRDLPKVESVLKEGDFDYIFHLAAQPLVLKSFEDPLETFSTNVMGGVHLLDGLRKYPCQAIVFVTTDKVYENKEWPWGYRENDPLGGDDPYSASKAMGELLVKSYRASFFKGKPLIATARAGNVIGGGDFSAHRLLPDFFKSILNDKKMVLRNPKSTRPWLYVLEPLLGYITLLQKLVEGEVKEGSYNFGPKENKAIPTQEVVKRAIQTMKKGSFDILHQEATFKEKAVLQINWDKAHQELNWAPKFTWQEAVDWTVNWYRFYEENQHKNDLFFSFAEKQIMEYLR